MLKVFTIENQRAMQVLIVAFVLSFTISSFQCNQNLKSKAELDALKSELFCDANDVSKWPIYADPPDGDYEDAGNGIFRFQIDTMQIAKIIKYREELEPQILQYIDSAYCWVYLAAYLKYESAIPPIKDKLLHSDRIYGWEGPDYEKVESYLYDEQYCYQLAYIACIEYISGKPLNKAITLNDDEVLHLKSKADKCNEMHMDSLDIYCPGRWLMERLDIQ